MIVASSHDEVVIVEAFTIRSTQESIAMQHDSLHGRKRPANPCNPVVEVASLRPQLLKCHLAQNSEEKNHVSASCGIHHFLTYLDILIVLEDSCTEKFPLCTLRDLAIFAPRPVELPKLFQPVITFASRENLFIIRVFQENRSDRIRYHS